MVVQPRNPKSILSLQEVQSIHVNEGVNMDNKGFFQAYRLSLYEAFFDEKNSPSTDLQTLRHLKKTLDEVEPAFANGEIGVDGLVDRVNQELNSGANILWNPGRDLCIATHIAIGGAVLAAWVASGGTLVIGSAVAGVTISNTVVAALVGGASAATIACIAGSCGNC